MHLASIRKIGLKYTLVKLLSHLPGTKELQYHLVYSGKDT